MRGIHTIVITGLLVLALYASSIDQTIDFLGSTCTNNKTIQIQRVERKVNITYTYPLQTARSWQQFPDMKIQFNLTKKQFVRIKYELSLRTAGNDFFKSRVIIDGVENPWFRYVTGYLYWRTHAVSHEVLMETGLHVIYVEYDQAGGNYEEIPADWAAALFTVTYFE